MESSWANLHYQRLYHVSCDCIFRMKFDGILISIRRNPKGEYILVFREMMSNKNIEVGTNSPGLLVKPISAYGAEK